MHHTEQQLYHDPRRVTIPHIMETSTSGTVPTLLVCSHKPSKASPSRPPGLTFNYQAEEFYIAPMTFLLNVELSRATGAKTRNLT
jgi:hypothetical protein